MVAQALGREEASMLSASGTDLDRPAYRRLKDRLIAIRSANPQCRFVYLMTRKPDGSAVFLVDSEPESSENYSPPGQVYGEATDLLLAALETGQEIVEGPQQDRWGTWISALVPLFRPEEGGHPVLLGMDIDARDWKQTVAFLASLPSALAAIAVLLGLLAFFLLQNRRDIRMRQAELEESEGRFAQLAAQSRTFVWEVDAQGLFTLASPVSETVLGYRPDELVGQMHLHDLHPAAEREAFRQDILRAFGSQEPFVDFESQAQTRDGRMVWLSTNAIPQQNRDGSLCGYRGTSTDITKRKQAEDARRASEAKLGALFDSMGEIAVIHELVFDGNRKAVDYRLIECNAAFARLMGKKKEDLLGKCATEVYGTASAPYLDVYAQTAVSGTPCHFETFYAPMGRYFFISAVALGGGRFATISTDITGRKRAEDRVHALLEESNRARQALLGILEDEKHARQELGRQSRAQQLLIQISSSFVNRPLETVDEAVSDSLRNLAEFSEADRAYVFVYDFPRQVCTNIHEWCAPGIEPHIDRLQEIPLSLMPDWLEAHRAGRPVHVPDVQALPPGPQREELERQSIQSLVAVPLMEANRCIGFVGFDSVRQRRGYSEQDQNLLKVFAELLVNIRMRKETGRQLAEQSENLKARLRETLESREALAHLLAENNQIRQELEQHIAELKRAQTALMRAEKLASLGKLISEVAHEISNPLMIISCNAQLALMPEIGSREAGEKLRIIGDECQRAKAILKRLLRFSAPSKGQTREVDINASLEMVVGMMEPQLKWSHVEIRRAYAEHLPPVSIDEPQMQEVFMNLINNAREAMPDGGTLSVSTALVNGRLRLDFRDTGIGISEEAQKSIFDPFFTTKEDGSGLGLPVCYAILKAHEGEIGFESKPRAGTTFTLWLPMARSGPPETPTGDGT